MASVDPKGAATGAACAAAPHPPADTAPASALEAVGYDPVKERSATNGRVYRTPILAKLTSQRAWAIYWILLAAFSIAQWPAGVLAPFRPSQVNFAIYTGVTTMIMALIMIFFFLLRPEQLQDSVNNLMSRAFKGKHVWAWVAWLAIYWIFWVATMGALGAVLPTYCDSGSLLPVFGDMCTRVQVMLAFSVFCFLLVTYKVPFAVADALAQ
ncbi:hypothetical protein DFJ74DRAFT_664396, partial [Hyaloraphidium curvatum]